MGGAIAKTIVRKNLILRLAVPRFFVQGDEVMISALVHNYLATEKTVRVSLDVKGLDVLDGATRDVHVLPPRRGPRWIGGCARSRCAPPRSPARRSPMKRPTRWSWSCRSTFPA